ncbi:Pycsar system effector family protein [Kitasatospora sp. MBT66]|uniref:Pycsar system effector family protein n=1 Tax=Kitasatospora sp. MBT66 TaxID=1444769 RepID=UPI0006919CAB|nr:Pycsar system effector family protein [Kitasatospora sp. MBT66]
MAVTNGGGDVPSPAEAEVVLGARCAAVLVELQRADGKAAALCALSGGMLAAVVAAAPSWSTGAALPTAAVLCGCVLLAAAAAAALLAIRPVLPQGRLSAGFGSLRSGSPTAGDLAGPAPLDRAGLIDLETRRLQCLAALAERKFRAIRASVDLIAAAGTVTGIGLLISCTN